MPQMVVFIANICILPWGYNLFYWKIVPWFNSLFLSFCMPWTDKHAHLELKAALENMLIIVLRCSRLIPILLLQQEQLFETNIYEGPSQNDDVHMDTVPVVVKPGHIRFEPVGKGLMISFYFRLSMLVHWWEPYFVRSERRWGSILCMVSCYICLISYF